MKNTKILFIRLYIGTLYSNFIVPLRGSNYIQLLYGDLQKRLGFFFGQIRWLAWQEHINELEQCSDRIRTVFDASKCHHQNTTKTPPGITTKRGWISMNECGSQPEEIGSIRINSGQKIGADRCESVQFLTNAGTKMRTNECRWVQKIGTNRDTSGRNSRLTCDQMRPNATRKQGDQGRLKATKNKALTYHYLILPNNLFMFCVGQK